MLKRRVGKYKGEGRRGGYKVGAGEGGRRGRALPRYVEGKEGHKGVGEEGRQRRKAWQARR